MVGRRRNFWREGSGTALIEGLLVFPLVLLTFASLIEFGFAVFQWNQTAKALQLGARLAAVSNPLVEDMTPLVDDYPTEEGAAPPDATVSVSCGAGTTACAETEINRLVFGSDGICDPSFGTTKPGMCDFNGRIRPENIRITYARSGLGYVGRPGGPVVTVTIALSGLTFDFFFLGRLLGLDSFEIPAFPVTITGEDMNSCQNECP